MIGLAGLLFASFTSLFSVVNPLAAMPLFLSLTDRYTEKERIRIAKKSEFLYVWDPIHFFVRWDLYSEFFWHFIGRDSNSRRVNYHASCLFYVKP